MCLKNSGVLLAFLLRVAGDPRRASDLSGGFVSKVLGMITYWLVEYCRSMVQSKGRPVLAKTVMFQTTLFL
jgi:hypothetical protein